MIERYSRPEMRAIWTEENKFQAWLEVELAACEAWAELGHIPHEDTVAPFIRSQHRPSVIGCQSDGRYDKMRILFLYRYR